MGRCQGSFCLPNIINIMADYYKTSPDKIIIRGSTPLVTSPVKFGGIYGKNNIAISDSRDKLKNLTRRAN